MLPSTLDMVPSPSTWNPRQKDRLSLEGPHETPRFWKPAFASKRSAWLARLVEQCWHVSIKGVFHTERTVRSVTRISIFSGWCLFWSARFALQCTNNFFELFWNVRLFLLWRAVCFKIIFVSCTISLSFSLCFLCPAFIEILWYHRQPKRSMCGFGLQRSFGRNILELLVYYLMPNKCKKS